MASYACVSYSIRTVDRRHKYGLNSITFNRGDEIFRAASSSRLNALLLNHPPLMLESVYDCSLTRMIYRAHRDFWKGKCYYPLHVPFQVYDVNGFASPLQHL